VAFTTSDGTAPEGAKDRMLQGVIGHISIRCPNIRFTLSDKDISEINAFRARIPAAKHQLCYWHAIRYIGDHLAKDEPPAAFDPRKPNTIFAFIDPTWAPGVTAGWLEDGVHRDDAEVDEPVDEGVNRAGSGNEDVVEREENNKINANRSSSGIVANNAQHDGLAMAPQGGVEHIRNDFDLYLYRHHPIHVDPLSSFSKLAKFVYQCGHHHQNYSKQNDPCFTHKSIDRQSSS